MRNEFLTFCSVLRQHFLPPAKKREYATTDTFPLHASGSLRSASELDVIHFFVNQDAVLQLQVKLEVLLGLQPDGEQHAVA